MVKLDSTDRSILYELDKDSRQPVSDIAKKLKLSRDVVGHRIKRMVDSKVILGFHPILNVYNLGYCPYRLNLKFKPMPPESEKGLFDYLKKNERVGWLVSCEGAWEMSMVVWAKDVYDFQDFLSELLEKYGACIEKKKIAIVHKLMLYSRACLLGDETAAKGVEKSEVVSEGKPMKLDESDWDLIELIEQDSRISLKELSKKLSLSPNAVDYRLKRLLSRGVIQGFRIAPNYELLGLKYYKVYFHFSEYPRKTIEKMIDYARKNPFVVYIDDAFGGGDLELEFQVNDRETFLSQLLMLRKKFDNIIRDYDIVTFDNEYKFRFIPPRPREEAPRPPI